MEKKISSNSGGIALKINNATTSQGGIEIKCDKNPIRIEMERNGFVYLVIDCSASMFDGKIREAKIGSINFAKKALSKGYSVGLISFSSRANHICEPVKDMELLERHIQSLSADSSTNLAHAIDLSKEWLQNRIGLRIMVIATDGQPDDPDAALTAAEMAKRREIDIITIGTYDANTDFLKKIASKNDLNVMVSNSQLAAGISSTTNMLPQLKKGGTS